MTDRSTCIACAKVVNAAAVKCPHCGAAQREAEGLATAKVSAEEAAALLLMTDAGESTPTAHAYGPIGNLVMPHPATRGGWRAADIGLAIVGLPVTLAGMAFLMLVPRTRSQLQNEPSLGLVGTMALLGGMACSFILTMAGHPTLGVVMALMSAGALVARHFVQHAAVLAKRPDLVGKIEPAKGPELPVAVARHRPAAASSTESAEDDELVAVPEAPAPPAEGDEPSFLK